MSGVSDSDHRPRPRKTDEFRVAAFTGRTTVQALLSEMARESEAPTTITFLPLDADLAGVPAEVIARADVAVVDGSIDRKEAIALCEALRKARAVLPISAVFCCPHAATAADLPGLLAAGVEGLLDLQLSPADTLDVLRGVARGQRAFHLQMAASSGTSLVELLTKEDESDEFSEDDLVLLRLVAAGLTDQEIGRKLYLSHHTVKHRIERLRHRVHARNRIQLAAWAGSHEALRAAGDAPRGAPAGKHGGEVTWVSRRERDGPGRYVHAARQRARRRGAPGRRNRAEGRPSRPHSADGMCPRRCEERSDVLDIDDDAVRHDSGTLAR
jgi:DNA-binding NarL/FixJ family response regulator